MKSGGTIAEKRAPERGKRAAGHPLNAVAFDTETTGLALHYAARIFAWAQCDAAGASKIRRIDPGNTDTRRSELSTLLNGSAPLVMHNAKFDLTAAEYFVGSPARAPIHDTRLLSHILQNHHHSHTLDHLSWELAGYARVDETVKTIAAGLGGFHRVPPHIMSKYQRLDVERTMCLFLFFYPKVAANPQWLDCYNAELAAIAPTIRMERRGLMIARARTQGMIAELETKADEAREEIYRIAGKRFNPESDPQLRRVLYRDFGFPVLRTTAKSREPSLDKTTLLELQAKTKHPILDAILRARAYTKGVTVLGGYLTLADRDDTIHPTINTCAAITGRQSSDNPNLQNVQKSGAEATTPYPVRARHAFRPRPGYINLHLDYSGIEMRLLVHYAEEPEMVRCMNEGDGDVHALGAQTFYGPRFTAAVGDARKALRYRAKSAGFALAYGASPAKLAVTLGVPPAEGKAAYNRYRERFPKLAGLCRQVIGWVRERGYADSVFGRRYHVPAGEAYIGTNYLIQGTAAEVLKRAEARVDGYNRRATGDEVKCLLPVHDELIIEYPRDRLPDLPGYLRDVRREMVGFPQFRVPLNVDASVATASWEHKFPMAIPK